MKIFGFAGWSGAGKTTLIEPLLAVFVARGLRVSTLKHAHHSFDLDVPGKDSHRHRAAGATEVMVVSANRWAQIHELRGDPEPPFDELVARMAPVDLLLVEGFKRHAHPKLEIHRPSLGKPPLWPEDRDIVAVASDEPLAGLDVPNLPLDDHRAIAQFILGHIGLA
jgi:molybdopterin-guanine dinucleotide biosynthesis adapter protein